MQALSVAGGLSDRGTSKGIKVTRRQNDGTTKTIEVELKDKLNPDDVIHVKERLF